MKIVINSIDATSSAPRGFTPLASYLVRFGSSTFSGSARLVPASGFADAQPGDQVVVELAQESVSDFKVCGTLPPESVQALPQPGDFMVCGIVTDVVLASEPAGNRFTYVRAGEAYFCLSLEEIGDCRPERGSAVEFIVHDVSLWDEAI